MSVAQQDAVIGDLVLAMQSGERWLIRSLGAEQEKNPEVEEIQLALSRCLTDIQVLLRDIEDGSFFCASDTENIQLIVDFLLSEMRVLESRMKVVLSLTRGRGH